MTVLYEDNHLIIINKSSSEIVQGDKTGDIPLSEIIKDYLKEKYNKPGIAQNNAREFRKIETKDAIKERR